MLFSASKYTYSKNLASFGQLFISTFFNFFKNVYMLKISYSLFFCVIFGPKKVAYYHQYTVNVFCFYFFFFLFLFFFIIFTLIFFFFFFFFFFYTNNTMFYFLYIFLAFFIYN